MLAHVMLVHVIMVHVMLVHEMMVHVMLVHVMLVHVILVHVMLVHVCVYRIGQVVYCGFYSYSYNKTTHCLMLIEIIYFGTVSLLLQHRNIIKRQRLHLCKLLNCLKCSKPPFDRSQAASVHFLNFFHVNGDCLLYRHHQRQ